jgi:hypothetical protein
VVETAKWQSWRQLEDMSHLDAMRLYVKTLDEEQVGRGLLWHVVWHVVWRGGGGRAA